MTHLRPRSTALPVRRPFESRLVAPRPWVDDVVLTERPSVPLHCLRPAVLTEAAERFAALFPGHVLYAVKCNPEPVVLRALWAGGLRHFDCASIQEVRLVRKMFPQATIHFMHPIKARPAIREAWEWHGVRDFVVDSADELAKLLEETAGTPGELGVVVRLALPKGGATWDLSGKFGAQPDEAAELLRMARAVAPRIGLCFHVGSQCLDPTAWERALERVGVVLARAAVDIDVLDVGGGFPVAYADVVPPPLEDFIAAIGRGLSRLELPSTTEIWAEPGRALAAPGQSVVVRIEGRRGDYLFINDGIYGSLSDAGPANFRFPCRLIRGGGRPMAQDLLPFGLFGPTCDSADRMKGPFWLPADAREGDWIEIGQLGAYGIALATPFNGFDQVLMVEVADRPLVESASCREAGRAA